MDIAALLLACSVHPDDALLSSIAYVHGRGNPYAVIDVSLQTVGQDDARLGMIAPSPTAARAAVERIVAKGGEPVLGLLPVRPEWAGELGKTLDDLFDSCGVIAVASAKLSEFDYACRSHGTELSVQRRDCLLDLYGGSLGLPALRRAVLADLTLPSPFPSDSYEPSLFPSPLAPMASSGLFFAVPMAAPALPSSAPAPRREERR